MGARLPEEHEQVAACHWAVMEATAQLGILKGTERLEHTRKARTVRDGKGRTVITDGPLTETGGRFAGYDILDCKYFDEMPEWTAKIPIATARGINCERVRPIRKLAPKAG